jgi:hypothetical protein
VLAVRQKYTTESGLGDAGYLLYEVWKQQVATLDDEGHWNAIVGWSEHSSPHFRFPETKSAHLKFSPLSDNNLWRLICLHAMSLFI